MTTTKKIHHHFLSVSILITSSRSRPEEQRETHCKPTDQNAPQFGKKLDMNFTIKACLHDRTRRDHSSTNSTDITKLQAFPEVLWGCHQIQLVER